MYKGTLLRNNRALGALALSVFIAALAFAHMQGGIRMNVGEMQLSIQTHQEEGLVFSFVSLR